MDKLIRKVRLRKHQIWLESYLQNLALTNKSPATIKNYTADLIKFIQWYESVCQGTLNEANTETISQYKNYLDGRAVDKKKLKRKSSSKIIDFLNKIIGKLSFRKKAQNNVLEAPIPMHAFVGNSSSKKTILKVASKRRHLSSIKNFYEFLKQSNEDTNDLFTNNPVKSKIHGIKLKDEDVQNTKLLSKEDWKKINEWVYRPQERLLVYLLYYGGLRLAEVRNLQVDQFNRQNDTITFIRKGGIRHTLKIQNAFVIFQLLDVHLKRKDHPSPYVFSHLNGKPYTTRALYDLILRIFKKSKVSSGLTPHSFRKACATNLYRKSKDLLKVRDYLNHSDAKVTQTYIEVS